jgi:hypothetical protein
MSGIIAVYSLVISVLISDSLDPYKNYTLYSYVNLTHCRVDSNN